MVVLPPSIIHVLREYKKNVFAPWLFPSPGKPNQPIDPDHIRKQLHRILDKINCKQVRFHDLRHTFVTLSLENGMDVKTLSAIIGHASASTTLDIYTHVTDEMEQRAALSIDRGIAGISLPVKYTPPPKAEPEPFQPVLSQRRRRGTGYVKNIKGDLWEGRYSPKLPDGTRWSKNVYAHSRQECETLLAQLIPEMNREVTRLRLEAGKRKAEMSI